VTAEPPAAIPIPMVGDSASFQLPICKNNTIILQLEIKIQFYNKLADFNDNKNKK